MTTKHVELIKQLSHSNWQFELAHCKQELKDEGLLQGCKLEVRDMPVGKRNKNRNSGRSLVAIFDKTPSPERLEDMRFCVHWRWRPR